MRNDAHGIDAIYRRPSARLGILALKPSSSLRSYASDRMTDQELLAELDRIAEPRREDALSANRKMLGQVFTPPTVALMMAGLLKPVPGREVRGLDRHSFAPPGTVATRQRPARRFALFRTKRRQRLRLDWSPLPPCRRVLTTGRSSEHQG